MTKNGGKFGIESHRQGLGVGETQSSRPISNCGGRVRVLQTPSPARLPLLLFPRKADSGVFCDSGTPCFLSLQDNTFLKKGDNSALGKSYQRHFPNSICSLCVSVSHVSILKFQTFFIVIGGMLISGQ